MIDLAFYNVGCEDARGKRVVSVGLRRAVRRILRPIFVRQTELYRMAFDRIEGSERVLLAVHQALLQKQHEVDALRAELNGLRGELNGLRAEKDGLAGETARLSQMQARLEGRVETALALAWDQVAVTRRLTVLEDNVNILRPGPVAGAEDDDQPAIPFPGLGRVKIDTDGLSKAL